MKYGLYALSNLRRALLRPYKSFTTIASCSTKCLNEEVPELATDSVEMLLKRRGCSDDDLSELFRRNPGLRNTDASQLEAKLRLLSAVGVPDSELAKIAKCRPRFLSCHLNRCFSERLKFFKTLFDSDEALAKAIARNPSLLTYDFHSKIKPAVAIYEGLGLSMCELATMLVHRPTLITRTSFDAEKMAFLRKIGVPPSSKLYKYVVTLIGVSRAETIRAKIANLERFGLSEEEILHLFGRSPLLMTLSVEKVERNVRFVIGEMKLLAEAVLREPKLLQVSVEAVLRPRVLLARKMREMGLERRIEGDDMVSVMRMSEDRFFKAYVAKQPGDVGAELAEFYAKAKEVKRLAEVSKKKLPYGFPF